MRINTDRIVSLSAIEITYASVYGDRWRIRSDRMIPEQL